MEPPTVVIDNGTGYSKMGYAGNLDPSYIIPSTIATSLNKVSVIFIYRKLIYKSNRKVQNSRVGKWITISEMRLWSIKKPTKSAICSREVRLKTGKVLRNSGINLSTHTLDANPRNTDSF